MTNDERKKVQTLWKKATSQERVTILRDLIDAHLESASTLKLFFVLLDKTNVEHTFTFLLYDPDEIECLRVMCYFSAPKKLPQQDRFESLDAVYQYMTDTFLSYDRLTNDRLRVNPDHDRFILETTDRPVFAIEFSMP